jgi:putative NADH-flavin reductase
MPRRLPYLAASLPLAIPIPQALGQPAADYSWNWSVCRWLDGKAASSGTDADVTDFASSQRWDTTDYKWRLIMAHVLIIGASKGIGLETVRSALAAGHQVRALARSATSISLTHPQLKKMGGNALVREDVEGALQGVDVVIQTLGVSFTELFGPVHLFSDATRVLVAAMAARGVRRLICVTGFGAGDSRDSISVLQRLPFHAVFGRAYADKSIQEQLIKETALDWTIVRPGVLTDGVRTGRYQALDQPSQWRNGIIARADVADFCVKQIGNPASVRKAYVLVN